MPMLLVQVLSLLRRVLVIFFCRQLVLIFQPTFWHPCARTPLFPADLAGFCPVDASLLLCLSS